MKQILYAIPLSICISSYANDMARIQELGAQMCDKAFQCTQAEFDQALQQNPQMRDQILAIKNQFAQQCAAQHQQKYLTAYSQPNHVDKQTIKLAIACFEKQASASCEYYRGEKELTDFAACKQLNVIDR